MTQWLTRSRASRTVAFATVLLLGVELVPSLASAAGVGGTTTGAASVVAGTWGVTVSVPSMAFTNNTYQTSKVTNAGTIGLIAQSYSVVVSNPASGSPTFKVFQCGVAWASNLCSGGAGTQVGGTLTKNSTTTITSNSTLPAAAAVYLQVEPAGVTATTTVTLSSKVTSPVQLRAAIKTNQ